jgi:predicted nucleic acid-binding protein
VIYLDTSALVTFIVRRPHADALDQFLADARTKTCTSTIGMVETVRTCDQLGSFPNLMTRLTHDHDEVHVSDWIRDAAANLPGAVRSLDALHIASAEQLGAELKALITYDRRMAKVARERGLPVEMPGVE